MRERIKQWIAAVTLAVVVMAFVYFAVVTAQQNTVLARQNESSLRTEHALCILRADLQQRAESTEAFLKANPGGIPGIPAEQLQQSIDNQLRTVNALQLLECESWETT